MLGFLLVGRGGESSNLIWDAQAHLRTHQAIAPLRSESTVLRIMGWIILPCDNAGNRGGAMSDAVEDTGLRSSRL